MNFLPALPPRRFLLLVVLLFSFSIANTQEILCIDPSHQSSSMACPTVYIPLCGCLGSDPGGNPCEAFYWNFLSCWSQNCDQASLGCEVAFEYVVQEDQILLKDISPTAEGDSVNHWVWQYTYETFGENEPEAVFEMPPGENLFKISLGIDTQQGCTAFCTYIIRRNINATEKVTRPDVRVYPNPATETIFIEGATVYHRLYLFSPDGYLHYQDRLRNGGQHMVDVSRLSPGLYFLKLNGGDGVERVFKVVIQ